MVLMTTHHNGVRHELEKRVVPGTRYWRKKRYWYGITRRAKGSIIDSRAYPTLDEAVEALPLPADRDYVPYVTKYERRD